MVLNMCPVCSVPFAVQTSKANGANVANVYDLLTPRGLAFWIMDDGSRQGLGLHLSVFSSLDVDRLRYALHASALQV